MHKIIYNTNTYRFRDILEDILDTKSLLKIHEETHFEKYDLFTRDKDQSTKYHRKYYDNFLKLEQVYTKFINEIIRPQYNEPIVYQKIPTFRLHFPGNIAVGEWHKDKWYRDSKWHEDVCELNYYLPFTKTYGTNTIWVESEEDKGDFQCMNAEYGECIQWDGVNLTHGNKKNITNATRISVDFRVIPLSTYKPSKHSSINTKTKFEIGGYYKVTKT